MQLDVDTFSQMALFGSWITCYEQLEKVGHMKVPMSVLHYSTMVAFILILSTAFFVTDILP